MGRGRVKSIPIEERREQFTSLTEGYWKYYFENKDDGDPTGHVMEVLRKKERERKRVARGDNFEENNLSLSEMKIIDDKFKRELRSKYE